MTIELRRALISYQDHHVFVAPAEPGGRDQTGLGGVRLRMVLQLATLLRVSTRILGRRTALSRHSLSPHRVLRGFVGKMTQKVVEC